MPSHEQMISVVKSYVAAFDSGDAEAVVQLYAADATVEDPIGSPALRGHEAIRQFYQRSMATGAKLRLEGAVRTGGNHAAFAFSAHLDLAGGHKRIDVIDSFRFDAAGKVTEMRAFWGPDNMHGF
jgi:steroid Delta-isomerase